MSRYTPIGKPFSWTGRVYFGDTDAAGIVYHGRYVYWMEAARIDFLRHIGCPYSQFISEKIAFMPVSLTLNFKKPMKFEDEFYLEISVLWVKKASFCIQNQFYLNGTLCVSGEVILATVDETQWKPCSIPDSFISHLSQFEAQ
jgi:acyl-CoA thioester hydrolase